MHRILCTTCSRNPTTWKEVEKQRAIRRVRLSRGKRSSKSIAPYQVWRATSATCIIQVTLLGSFGDQAWLDFAGYPIFIVHPFGGDPNYIAISKTVSRWIEEGYKRAAEAENSRELVPAIERAPETLVDAKSTVFISYSWDSKEHERVGSALCSSAQGTWNCSCD